MNQVIQKILYIATLSPDIGIDDEFNEIKTIMQESNSGFSVDRQDVISVNQIKDLILDYTPRPQIIHICGHGTEDGKILIPKTRDTQINFDRAKPQDLKEFFENTPDVKYVILHFCYSYKAVKLISPYVQCVIGINKGEMIERRGAVEFSKNFYKSLKGKLLNQSVVDEAFSLGTAAAFPRTQDPERYIKITKSIALKAYNNLYVSAKDHSGNEVVADEEKIDTWETFELILQEGNKVALKAHNGQYVSADLRAGYEGKIVANRDKIDDWERFEWLRQEDGKVALKADNGKFVCADKHKQDRLIADRLEINDWEKFSIIDPMTGREKSSIIDPQK
ncbi:hypothetical protein ACE1CI_32375 [Aerosakkonemataceae cyanobacterium BLCC-F50]|uniref:DUF7910 domain-containing protein n=1 Tax=Floridaenema flaviceps BLCC-F50 TaxID=3153642 RepID=A0ABV4Y0X7_9CYAN